MKIMVDGIVREMNAEEIAELERARRAYEIQEKSRPLSAEEVTRLIIRQQINSLDIDDAAASRMADYFPELTQSGSLIPAGTRINWGGTVKRAAADLWDTAENTPDAAPNLWEDILYRNGIRIIPADITATNGFAKGELGWWGDALMQSIYEGINVWTPDALPGGWEEVADGDRR